MVIRVHGAWGTGVVVVAKIFLALGHEPGIRSNIKYVERVMLDGD